MTISADTLFHFTNSIQNLIGILTNEFYPRYSIEDWSMLHQINGVLDDEIAIPMVSFCDIPLSKIKNHVSFYGEYALGLKKEWGIKNGITPILYCHDNSFTTKCLASIRKEITGKSDNERDLFINVIDLLRFVKPYEGILPSKEKSSVIKFYDEREWRYVPTDIIQLDIDNGADVKKSLYKTYFRTGSGINWVLIKEENQKLNKYKLSFSPDDIKYIIINSENERLKVMRKIREIKGERHSFDSLERLCSKILSVEQIIADF